MHFVPQRVKAPYLKGGKHIFVPNGRMKTGMETDLLWLSGQGSTDSYQLIHTSLSDPSVQLSWTSLLTENFKILKTHIFLYPKQGFATRLHPVVS